MAQQSPAFDPASLRLFTEGGSYLDKYEMGLYPQGKNEIPDSHLQAGLRVAAAIQPLDVEGKPNATDGRILALVMGHSNCSMYFNSLQDHLEGHSDRLNPRTEIINAAVGGQQLPEIRQLKGLVWDRAHLSLSLLDSSPKQVQVVFLHTTYHCAHNYDHRPPGPFPETMQRMQQDMAAVLAHCLRLYPNLRVAYLTCDGFRHYTGFEPHVWQEAFAVKWLIESQIKGGERTSFEDDAGQPRRLPFLQWGPYFWNNTWDRTYFTTDGVHPASKARVIFVDKYWRFLQSDKIARTWLLL